MIEVKPYKKEDYSLIESVEPYADKGDFGSYYENGLAMTVWEDGVPIGCGGITEEMEVWLRLSERIQRKPKLLVQILDEVRMRLIRDFGITFLKARVQEDYPEAVRLVEYFGFEKVQTVDLKTHKIGVYKWNLPHSLP